MWLTAILEIATLADLELLKSDTLNYHPELSKKIQGLNVDC